MTFLANPHRIWAKGTFQEKRTVLKLTFLDNLAYSRETGYRTPKTTIPSKALDDFSNLKSNMVEPRGVEPLTSSLPAKRSTS